KGGGEKPANLQKIFDWNQHYAQLGVQREAVASLNLGGGSMCPHFSAGHKFNLGRHPNADGAYVLRQVSHHASQSMDLASGAGAELLYANRFSCLPADLPFRPALTTPRPRIVGTQTAVVVGPPGEEICCDKYGRVKVQFHWDREGKKNLDSSCWVRVGT